MTPVRYHHGLLLVEAPGVRVCAGPQELSRQAPATANAQTAACRSRAPVTTLGRRRQPPGCLDPQARDSTGGVLGMLVGVKDPIRLLRRIAVGVVGTVILVVGLVLLVAPGPGLVVLRWRWPCSPSSTNGPGTQPRRRAGTRPFGGPQGGSQPRGHCLRWLRVDLRAERLDWVPAVLASLDRPFVIEQPDARDVLGDDADRERSPW